MIFNFNPRSHEGSDGQSPHRCQQLQISILAPTRGATIMSVALHSLFSFQSSLPRGERHTIATLDLYRSNFNPRSHEGSDRLYPRESYSKCKISILAPTRGATAVCPGGEGAVLFQSSLPRGERQFSRGYTAQVLGFQSSLPRGERRFSTMR